MSQYIILFKSNTNPETIESLAQDIIKKGGSIGHRYESTILGFSTTIPDSLLDFVVQCKDIECIEADGIVSVYAASLGIK